MLRLPVYGPLQSRPSPWEITSRKSLSPSSRPDDLWLFQYAATSWSTTVDTYTHHLSAFALNRSKDPEVEYETASDLIKGVYETELADGRWEGIHSLSAFTRTF
ncbi:uncharacterized protein ARMOST_06427 [Armillaria ostoyae]|uniref:Uncharacterized protein n=1 Tax=Armillaria ostoyae TaxID=47428 RepID=A0A284R319_ARMOS|nr:uncharacterized protein ARMOST_06427 [Armillaria ostoyae]